MALAAIPAGMAIALVQGQSPQWVLIGGLTIFGALFALDSSLHGYLILRHAAKDGVSLDIGFY